ncbi:MAG TPA: hypothetical protein VI488_10410 [Candidatus Angelobacter sp.]
MTFRSLHVLFLLLTTLTLAVPAQNPNPAENPALPTVSFDCLWEAATPQEYTVTARSTGSARYVSSNPVRTSEDRAQDPDYTKEFTLSSGGSANVFAWTAQARYFDGDFDYKKHAVADTGRKILTFADPTRHFQTTYNWSDNPAIDQLTRFFQGVSSTIEHGRKLEFLHRYDKLGLEAQLKAMEDEAQSRYLAELQIIAPVLESIAGDSSVMNIARQRARRLLQRAKAEAANGIKTNQ